MLQHDVNYMYMKSRLQLCYDLVTHSFILALHVHVFMYAYLMTITYLHFQSWVTRDSNRIPVLQASKKAFLDSQRQIR